MDFSKLKQINQANLEKSLLSTQKTEEELANLRLQEVFVKSIESLAKFIEGHTTKAVVLNQLQGYMTSSDGKQIEGALNSLHDTLKTHKNTDIEPIVEVMAQAVEELKQIPKSHQDITIPEPKDYTENFQAFVEVANRIEDAIKAQNTVVEAPIVNVEAPNVEVEAPDLKPLGDDLKKSFKEAVKAIAIPTPKDYTKVLTDQLKEQKRTNQILEELPTGGGSGGSSIAPFLVNNALPTFTAPTMERYDYDDATTIYVGTALIGTGASSTGWTITKYDLTDPNNASALIATDVSWSNRTSGSYS